MSRQDFQNGFVVGFTSGGVFSVADEKVIKEYARKHLKYNELYHYNVADFKNYSVDENYKGYGVEVINTTKLVNGEVLNCITFSFRLFTHNGIIELADTPLVVAEDESGMYYENEASIVDAGINVAGEVFSLSRIAEEFVDGSSIVLGESKCCGVRFDKALCLSCEVSLFSRDRAVLDAMAEEVVPLFTASDDFYLYYKNEPWTTVEGAIYV